MFSCSLCPCPHNICCCAPCQCCFLLKDPENYLHLPILRKLCDWKHHWSCLVADALSFIANSEHYKCAYRWHIRAGFAACFGQLAIKIFHFSDLESLRKAFRNKWDTWASTVAPCPTQSAKEHAEYGIIRWAPYHLLSKRRVLLRNRFDRRIQYPHGGGIWQDTVGPRLITVSRNLLFFRAQHSLFIHCLTKPLSVFFCPVYFPLSTVFWAPGGSKDHSLKASFLKDRKMMSPSFCRH